MPTRTPRSSRAPPGPAGSWAARCGSRSASRGPTSPPPWRGTPTTARPRSCSATSAPPTPSWPSPAAPARCCSRWPARCCPPVPWRTSLTGWSSATRGCPPSRSAGRTRARSPSWRVRHGWGPDQHLISTFVRLVPEKGLDRIVDIAEAARGRDDLVFAIAGSGPLRDPLAARLQARGLASVRLLGDLDPDRRPICCAPRPRPRCSPPGSRPTGRRRSGSPPSSTRRWACRSSPRTAPASASPARCRSSACRWLPVRPRWLARLDDILGSLPRCSRRCLDLRPDVHRQPQRRESCWTPSSRLGRPASPSAANPADPAAGSPRGTAGALCSTHRPRCTMRGRQLHIAHPEGQRETAR